MSAGRKSLIRVADKLLFVEQMLAFSSPTMVVSVTCALGHTAFIHTMLRFDGDPVANISLITDPQKNMVVIMKDGAIYKNETSAPRQNRSAA